MDNKTMSEFNREAWNEALTYHQKARNKSLQEGFKDPDFTTFNRDCDKLLLPRLRALDLKGKTISQLPCNNGRELLSIMKFGVKKAVGFDISDTAIEEAKELTAIAGLNADFIRTGILEIGPGFNNQFDFIYISEGSFQWFASVDEYFQVVSRLLKKGGRILIYEMHPFAYFFEQAYDLNREVQLSDLISYFEPGPYHYKTGIDYVGQTTYDAKTCYWFMHKMSDIINAMIKNDIEILEFQELNMEMANNTNIRDLQNFPLSYIMEARKR